MAEPAATPQDQQGEQKIAINSRQLMKICAGGIVKVFGKEMEPETLAAIAAAASTFAALEQNTDMAEMKRQLEQLQNEMKVLALGSAKCIA